MQVTLPEEALPATLRLNPELHMSDDEYYEFCMANPEVFFERTAEGEIVIAPPVGLESNDREVDIASELRQWAKRDRRGRAYGISAEFILPTGAAYAPDAACLQRAPVPAYQRTEAQVSAALSGVRRRGDVAQRPAERRPKENVGVDAGGRRSRLAH